MSGVPPRPKLKVADAPASDAPPTPVAMRADRAAPVAVATKADKKRGIFDDLFPSTKSKARKKADLVHIEPTLDRSITQKSKAQQPTVTTPSQLRPPERTDVTTTRAKSAPAEQEDKNRTMLLVVAAVLLSAGLLKLSFSSLNTPPAETVVPSTLSAEQLQQHVDYHRNTIGRRLNRERMNVEYENMRNAPDISPTASRVPTANMMSGLPLQGEKPPTGYRDSGSVPADPDYADERTAYSLREQEAVQAQESQERSEYVRDFVANAAKAGLKVRVDPNGHVTVVGRAPAAKGQPAANASSEALPQ